jgi:4-hydroxy-tetrahydrodipicolinate synthase
MKAASIALRGVFAAALTPFDQNFEPDAAKAVPYYRALLDAGLNGLNVLGTTGEAMSVGLGARRAFMEALASANLPLERVMVGTGASALADAAELTRAAFDLGFAAALVIPPFYYREIDDDAVLRYYDALFERTRPPSGRVILYNFPRMSGITFHPDLVGRLTAQFLETIAGVKDSSNDPKLEAALHERFANLAIFPGSESLLLEARESGLAGCISGSVCLWPQLAQIVWSSGDIPSSAELARERAALGQPLIARVRERVADQLSDDSWVRSVPPL